MQTPKREFGDISPIVLEFIEKAAPQVTPSTNVIQEEPEEMPICDHEDKIPNEIVQDRIEPSPGGNLPSFSKSFARHIQIRKAQEAQKAGKNTSRVASGATEALILKYLAHRYRKSLNTAKKGFYMTLDDFVTVFPYLARATIASNLIRLRSLGLLNASSSRNKRKKDRTLWYEVPEKHWNAVEKDPIYFNRERAIEISNSLDGIGVIPAAVILHNFEYWESENRKVNKTGVKLSPSELARLLPFSLSTIKKAIKCLETSHIKEASPKTQIYVRKNTTK